MKTFIFWTVVTALVVLGAIGYGAAVNVLLFIEGLSLVVFGFLTTAVIISVANAGSILRDADTENFQKFVDTKNKFFREKTKSFNLTYLKLLLALVSAALGWWLLVVLVIINWFIQLLLLGLLEVFNKGVEEEEKRRKWDG